MAKILTFTVQDSAGKRNLDVVVSDQISEAIRFGGFARPIALNEVCKALEQRGQLSSPATLEMY